MAIHGMLHRFSPNAFRQGIFILSGTSWHIGQQSSSDNTLDDKGLNAYAKGLPPPAPLG
jgi:hypothetical protein